MKTVTLDDLYRMTAYVHAPLRLSKKNPKLGDRFLGAAIELAQ